MIPRLQRYIIAHIMQATFLFSAMMLGLGFFITCINEMRSLGQGDYGLWQALLVSLLQLPEFLYQFFPMAALVGCLMGLGTLASNSELIVMRTSTMSVWQITRAVLIGALLMISLVTVIGEVVAPNATQLANTRKTIALSGGQALAVGHGAWFRSDNTFINVEKIVDNRQLDNVHWYTLDDQLRLSQAGTAQQAFYQHDHWQLHRVAISNLQRNGEVTSQHLAHLTWRVDLAPHLLSLTQTTPEEMTLPKLKHYIQYLQDNNLQANHDQLVFWQRVLQPLASLVMVLLAIPFIFGPLRTVPVGARIVVGCAVGFIFYFANQLFGPFSSVYQLPPLLAASIPIVVFVFLGIYLVLRVR